MKKTQLTTQNILTEFAPQIMRCRARSPLYRRLRNIEINSADIALFLGLKQSTLWSYMDGRRPMPEDIEKKISLIADVVEAHV